MFDFIQRDAEAKAERREVMVEQLGEILTDVAKEVVRTTEIHGGFASAHEFYGVLLEEVDELWDIVKQKQKNRSREALRLELVQIAAMAIKGIESIDKFVGGTK